MKCPQIRLELPGDEPGIRDVTDRAFAPTPFGDGTESTIIDHLRQAGDLTLSLVADLDGEIVGHVAFSPVTINGEHGGWYGLGPVSVSPPHQRAGLGIHLIREGLARLEAIGANGCALIGDPGYYHRFGFRSDGNLTYREVDSKHVQWLSFGSQPANGALEFAPSFDQTD